jgi:hypothetical protein
MNQALFELDFSENTQWAMHLRLTPPLLEQLRTSAAGCSLRFAESGTKHVSHIISLHFFVENYMELPKMRWLLVHFVLD